MKLAILLFLPILSFCEISVADYCGDHTGATDCGTQLQAALNAANAQGKILYFPSGIYLTSVTLVGYRGIHADRGATIKASSTLTGPVFVGGDASTSFAFDSSIEGLTIDGSGTASDCFYFRQYKHLKVFNVSALNCQASAYHIGDPSIVGGTYYEFIGVGLHSNRNMGSIAPGSIGLYIDAGTDNNISHTVLANSEIGVLASNGGNFFDDIHVWSNAGRGAMKTGAYDRGNGNFWQGFEADTVGQDGMKIDGLNTVVLGSRFFNNSTYSYDAIVNGINFTQANPNAALIANLFIGYDATHRFANDIYPASVASNSLTYLANFGSSIVNASITGKSKVSTDLVISSGKLRVAAGNGQDAPGGNAAKGGVLQVQASDALSGGAAALLLGSADTNGAMWSNTPSSGLEARVGVGSRYTYVRMGAEAIPPTVVGGATLVNNQSTFLICQGGSVSLPGTPQSGVRVELVNAGNVACTVNGNGYGIGNTATLPATQSLPVGTGEILRFDNASSTQAWRILAVK